MADKLKYKSKTWVNNTTPIDAESLNNLEDGIVNATNAINDLIDSGPATSSELKVKTWNFLLGQKYGNTDLKDFAVISPDVTLTETQINTFLDFLNFYYNNYTNVVSCDVYAIYHGLFNEVFNQEMSSPLKIDVFIKTSQFDIQRLNFDDGKFKWHDLKMAFNIDISPIFAEMGGELSQIPYNLGCYAQLLLIETLNNITNSGKFRINLSNSILLSSGFEPTDKFLNLFDTEDKYCDGTIVVWYKEDPQNEI